MVQHRSHAREDTLVRDFGDEVDQVRLDVIQIDQAARRRVDDGWNPMSNEHTDQSLRSPQRLGVRHASERGKQDALFGVSVQERLQGLVGRPPLMRPPTLVVTVRLDPELERRLDQVARRSGRSRSEVIRGALRRQPAVSQFEDLRRRIMPFAEARGYLTDEDIFRDVS